MKTVEYLDACKAKLGLTSDYQLAKVLELRPSAISAHRNNGGTFGAATAKKVAKILGVHPLRVRADAELERANSPEEKALWRELASKIVGVLVAAGAGALLTFAGPRPAYALPGGFDINGSSDAIVRPGGDRTMHCMPFWRRALAWLRGWL